MIPVGATNVGSIFLNFDDIVTNNKGSGVDVKNINVELKKGQEMGGFRLGSTVVLVFEAQGEWKTRIGQDIKMGETLV